MVQAPAMLASSWLPVWMGGWVRGCPAQGTSPHRQSDAVAATGLIFSCRGSTWLVYSDVSATLRESLPPQPCIYFIELNATTIVAHSDYSR